MRRSGSQIEHEQLPVPAWCAAAHDERAGDFPARTMMSRGREEQCTSTVPSQPCFSWFYLVVGN